MTDLSNSGAVARPGPRSGSRPRPGAALLTLVLAVGCSSLTEVESDLVLPGELDNAEGALALRAGAMGAFATAVRIGVSEVGLLTDELTITDPTDRSNVLDSRGPTEQAPGSPNAFTTRQDVLEYVAQALPPMERHSPVPSSRVGDLHATRGHTLLLLAEHFCSGVPIATFAGGRPAPGAPLSTEELLESALDAFAAAAGLAGDSAPLAHWAAIGAGRSLLNLGRFAEAASAVSGVPTSFVWQLEFASSPFTLANQVASGFPVRTVANREGGNGLPFVEMDDPRLDLQLAGARGGETSLRPSKYATTATPIVLASGVEARLIEAEAALHAQDVGAWLAIHEALRATAELPPLEDPGAPEARLDLHFAERAVWLFLTGHRLGDLRRLVRQYGRDIDQTFPTGLYKGGPDAYGAATHFPIPEGERANPHFSGCPPGV